MAQRVLNNFLVDLAESCQNNPLTEKWLIAPTVRIGLQWLDSIVFDNRPLLNVHVKTPKNVAAELARLEDNQGWQKYVSNIQVELLLADIFEQLQKNKKAYFSNISLSQGLIARLASTFEDLRLAGIRSTAISTNVFEVSAKGDEINFLLSEYERVLKDNDYIDYADVLQMACQRPTSADNSWPKNRLILVPADLQLYKLEEELINSIPEANRVELVSISNVGERPEIETFQAMGESLEIRQVFRRCLADGIPFDQVEILYSDYDSYVPRIYELTSYLFHERDELPITFEEGLPAGYFRPARAILAWIEWLRADFSQAILVDMIKDGLLVFDQDDLSFAYLADLLSSLPIGSGAERTREKIAWACLHKPQEDQPGYQCLKTTVERLLEQSLITERKTYNVFSTAIDFLNNSCRTVDMADNYCRKIISEQIESCLMLNKQKTAASALDPWDFLSHLVVKTKVQGQRPRPGHLYVTSLENGGHSNRPYTFVVGLDDGRYPGQAAQDPLILDAERAKLSIDLPTAAKRSSRRSESFNQLCQRISGKLILSYSCYNLQDDHEVFPSYLVFEEQDIARQQHIPDSLAECLDLDEFWLRQVFKAGPVKQAADKLGQIYPHLKRGAIARQARASSSFTEYDGYVPQAGHDFDSVILSAAALETFGSCPLEYFFKYCLEINLPKEYTSTPEQWLDPPTKGILLHTVFQQVMQAIDLPPVYLRDRPIVANILQRQIEKYKKKYPPANQEVFERERRQLEEIIKIFLIEEAEFCKTSHPSFFEVSLGLSGGLSENEQSSLDTQEPITISLPGGRKIKAQGKIDRIDRLPVEGQASYSVWDYKTGSSYKYKLDDPFCEGRIIQNTLYLHVAETRLKQKISDKARVESFGYFFPSTKEHGRRISWERTDLKAGLLQIELICKLMKAGCFPFTDDSQDVKYSDYLDAFQDIESLAEAMGKKLSNPDNQLLQAFAKLRQRESDESSK
jgi:ATP-dependent helicase/nuclease subunit B